MMIDDALLVLKLRSKTLSFHGYPNRKVTNPKEAVEIYKSEGFDVVITDINDIEDPLKSL